VGGNTLRRTRGGKNALLQNLWPKLTKIVCMDYRMSQTSLHADIVLPATQHYEKTTFGMPTPWPFILSMSHAVVPPYGEARGEWPALLGLLEKIAERAEQRGLVEFRHRSGVSRRYDELRDLFTLKGALMDEESVAREMLADSVASGNLPSGTTLETFREKGYSRYNDWAFVALLTANASPFPRGETHAPLRNHIELGHPYPTLTRRAQFLIDHPWYQEAGEDLPCHKEPPPMGGNHPFRLSGGHAWCVSGTTSASSWSRRAPARPSGRTVSPSTTASRASCFPAATDPTRSSRAWSSGCIWPPTTASSRMRPSSGSRCPSTAASTSIASPSWGKRSHALKHRERRRDEATREPRIPSSKPGRALELKIYSVFAMMGERESPS
jgi:anaerobic selenocysteine-containing dehydrogenase